MATRDDYLQLVLDYPSYIVLAFNRSTGSVKDYTNYKWEITLSRYDGEFTNPRIEECYCTRNGVYIIRSLIEAGLNDFNTWQESDVLLFIALGNVYGTEEMLKTPYEKKRELFAQLDWEPMIVIDIERESV